MGGHATSAAAGRVSRTGKHGPAIAEARGRELRSRELLTRDRERATPTRAYLALSAASMRVRSPRSSAEIFRNPRTPPDAAAIASQ